MSDPIKTILITGTSRGLGKAMAEGFITEGHMVIGCGRSAKEIEELKSQYTPPHRFDVLDVTDDAAVQQWAREVLKEVGAPDLLLNNAATINKNAMLWEVSADEFSQVIDINIKGVTNILRHFVPAMIAKGDGVIVNFSSGWGRSTSPEVAPYCATKWAIEGLTKALAEELPSGLAAVPLNPGIINTDMLQSCFGGSASHYPTAKQWAKTAIPFLLQLDARDNGQSLTVS